MQRNNSVAQVASHQACASCKHQRKKCDKNCILAPFFPAQCSREFQAIHKVFGVSNVQKLIKSLDEKDRNKAVDSLVWEAFCRQKDPILGPYGEYTKIYDELKVYKNSHWQQQSMTTATMQVLGQGGLLYKSPSNFVGWNCINGISNKDSFDNNEANINTNNNNSSNSNVLNYNHNNLMNNSSIYSFSSKQDGDDVGFLVPLQQNSINGLNSTYYLSGEFSPNNSKTMESVIWENGS